MPDNPYLNPIVRKESTPLPPMIPPPVGPAQQDNSRLDAPKAPSSTPLPLPTPAKR